ncbi:MAG TPA: helix-hairpin-helix domain-containing protein [Desulfuromonadales bacterium]|nr:helix-hairpin-helix domain-containing protein [Desulfuromonadales bacterium]
MKKSISIVTLFVLSLILSATVVCAVDVKEKAGAPNAKGAAKASTDKSKIAAPDAKAAVPDARAKPAEGKPAAKGGLVDINSASEAELKAIPGIGDAYAAKIIAGRPYANKAQLKSRKILDGTLYEKVKDQLIAKQPKK